METGFTQPIKEKLELLKQWEPANKWTESAGKLKELIQKWNCFQQRRVSSLSSSTGISVLFKPTGFDMLVQSINSVGDFAQLKLAAENNFKELCEKLDRLRKKTNAREYAKRDIEAIKEEITRCENLIQTTTESSSSSAPNSPKANSRSPSPERAQDKNWQPPNMPNPIYTDHKLSLSRWKELKDWEEIILEIQAEFESWETVLDNLKINNVSSNAIDVKNLKQHAKEIIELITRGSNFTPIDKQIKEEMEKAASKVDEAWDLKDQYSFKNKGANVALLKDLMEKLEKIEPLTPKPAVKKEIATTSEKDQDKKVNSRRRLFEDEPKGSAFGLVVGLSIISMTALILIIKRHEINKWFSRQVRKVN